MPPLSIGFVPRERPQARIRLGAAKLMLQRLDLAELKRHRLVLADLARAIPLSASIYGKVCHLSIYESIIFLVCS